jgi:nitroreductase
MTLYEKIKQKRYILLNSIRENYLIPICRKNRYASALYYFFFCKDFFREQQKVLNGKYLHLKALKENKPNEFHLRREIHRLEKGLIMKDRRPFFAVDFIKDVVKNYAILVQEYRAGNSLIDINLIGWANGVLNEYFTACAPHQSILEAKAVYDDIDHPIFETKSSIQVPFYRRDRNNNKVSYADLYVLAMQRRSVRWYEDRRVERSLIDKAIALATLSPSACNRQPFEFRIYDDESKKNAVASIPMGIKGFFQNIPTIIVLVGKLSAYLSERDRHVIYIDGGLAAMSFMLALETLGLSSVPINWPDIEYLEQKMEASLSMASDERPIMLIGVGYADPNGKIPFSQKKPPTILAKYN